MTEPLDLEEGRGRSAPPTTWFDALERAAKAEAALLAEAARSRELAELLTEGTHYGTHSRMCAQVVDYRHNRATPRACDCRYGKWLARVEAVVPREGV